MAKLYSYTLRYDDGAAPNPFGGICSLAICKPKIRSSAKIGDWIVGLGSTNAPSGNLSGYLVYAMRVERILTMKEYDEVAKVNWPRKIPNLQSSDLTSKLGDCIYDFSSGEPVLRGSVHSTNEVPVDLNGLNVLLSNDFYYFGRNAIKLPDNLKGLCHQTQGHKSIKNMPYLNLFVDWIRSAGFESGQMLGWPDMITNWGNKQGCESCSDRASDDEEFEIND